MYPLGSGLIERRRERELKGLKLQEAVKTDADIKAKALWETNAEKKLAAKGVTKVLSSLREDHEKHLNQRRKKLAELLEAEEKYYDAELDKITAMSLDRKGEMIQRARQLREEREQHRRELVQRKLDEQFKESCPQLHEVQSHMRERDCASFQLTQVEDRQRAKEIAKEADKEFAAVWEADRLVKEARHLSDIAKKKELEREDVRVRDMQLQELARRREEAKRIVAEERELMIEMWANEEAIAKQKQAELKAYKEKAARQFQAFNKQRLVEKAAEIARAREEDMAIVSAILERGAVLDRLEQEKKANYIAEIREYREQLSRQMQKEKVNEQNLDRLRFEEQEKAWEKRQLEWDKEEMMRNKLRDEVYRARDAQIRERLSLKREEKEELARYRRALIEEQRHIEEIEREERESEKGKKEAIKEYLEWQIREREREREMEREDEAFEREHARRTEMAFQEKIDKTVKEAAGYRTYYGKEKLGMYY